MKSEIGFCPFIKEKEFLFASLRALSIPRSTASLRTAPLSALDWGFILRAAQDHRILPFLALLWRKAGVARQLPKDCQDRLLDCVRQAAWENMVKMREFGSTQRLLEGHDIPIIPLKGVALTHLIYKRNPVRRMGDIDLLVQGKDLEKARALLMAQGFWAPPSANLWQDRIFNNGRRSLLRGDLDIDLQWEPRFRIAGHCVDWDFTEAWTSAYACPSLGRNVYLPSPLAQASYLLLQASYDFDRNYFFLVQLLDLALIMRKYALNSKDVLAAARLPLGRPTQVAKDLLDIARLSKMEEATWEVFFRERSNPAVEECGGIVDLKHIPTLRDKLVYAAGYFFPRKEYLRSQAGPKSSLAFAYLRHSLRLLGKARRLVQATLFNGRGSGGD